VSIAVLTEHFHAPANDMKQPEMPLTE